MTLGEVARTNAASSVTRVAESATAMTFGGLAARWRGARPAVGLVAWWLGGSVARWPGGLVARRPGGRVRARAASSMVGGGRGAARAAGRPEGACEDHLQTAVTGRMQTRRAITCSLYTTA